MLIQNVQIENCGRFSYRVIDNRTTAGGYEATANFPLHIIRMAWESGCDFESLADGFGQGLGTCGGDWSGIRDSSVAAIEKMLAVALNHITVKLANAQRGVVVR